MKRTRNANGGEALRRHMRWHRYVGLAAAFLALWLAVTGVLLNHGHALGLDRGTVSLPWVLDLYGIGTPEPVSYTSGGHTISLAGNSLYLDARRVGTAEGELVGAASAGGILAAVLAGGLVLLTPQGEIVEHVPLPAAVTGPLTGAGRVDDRVAIGSPAGVWVADAGLLNWEALPDPPPGWRAQPVRLPAAQQRAVAADARGRLLSRERLLADLHSGRILSHAGVWLMDLAAVALVLLVLTGIVIWYRRRNIGRR